MARDPTYRPHGGAKSKFITPDGVHGSGNGQDSNVPAGVSQPIRERALLEQHDPEDARGFRELYEHFRVFRRSLLPLYGMPLPSMRAALAILRAVAREGVREVFKLDQIMLSSTRHLGETYFRTPEMRSLLATWGMHLDCGPDVPGGGSGSAVNIANLTGFPDLIVPAGFTGDGLPVGLSFLGTAFAEPRLLALGYAFEQATQARRLPVHTPKLAGESIIVP